MELKEVFNKFANNAPKFSVAASSQANESFNNIVAHKALKNHCYSLSKFSRYRVVSAVATKNDGNRYLLGANNILSISPGKHTASYMAMKDKIINEEQQELSCRKPKNVEICWQRIKNLPYKIREANKDYSINQIVDC